MCILTACLCTCPSFSVIINAGLVCGAQFTEDKAWYRALVIGVNSDETLDVNYVDYGNSERLPFSALRKLPDSLLALPRQVRLVIGLWVGKLGIEDLIWGG